MQVQTVDLCLISEEIFVEISKEHAVLPVERRRNGSMVVGPIFRPGLAGCPKCYLARRRAAGWRGPDPDTSPMTSKAVEILASVLLEVGPHSLIDILSDGTTRVENFLPLPFCECRTLSQRPKPQPRSAFGALGTHIGLLGCPAIEVDQSGWATVAALARLPNGSCLTGMASDTLTDQALRRALHEALERYSLASPPIKTAENEYAVAKRILDGEPILVKVGALWLIDGAGDSDGTALDSDPQRALDRAICERLERRAFSKAWHSPVPLTLLEGDQCEGIVALPCEGSAFVALAYRMASHVPYLTLGLGAAFNTKQAARNARREMTLVEVAFASNTACEISAKTTFVGLAHDVAFAKAAFDPLEAETVGRWIATATHGAPQKEHSNLSSVLDDFPNAWQVDITPPDISDLGLSVVRVGLEEPSN